MSGRDHSGGTFFRWEPPDICVLTLIGDVTGEDMRQMVAAAVAQTAGRAYALGLIDMSRMGTISPEARLIAKNEARAIPMRGTAIIGASFHHRVMALLISKAVALVKKDSQPVAFLTTLGEARAWLAERREALLAKERDVRSS